MVTAGICPVLGADEVARFDAEGFLSLPRLAPHDEVQRMRACLAELFRRRAGRAQGLQYDMLGSDEDAGEAAQPTVINPSDHAPELRDIAFHRNALAIARQLLGAAAVLSFEHAILKPARSGRATPWHQDEAYRVDASFHYEQLSIWLALQDVPVEAGCMEFLRGSDQEGVRPHRSPGGDVAVHVIEYDGEVEAARCVACPVRAGEATVHHGRTLHRAGPNVSNVDRYAYILAFELPPSPIPAGRRFGWNDEKRTPNRSRRRRWLRRGGFVVEALRKWRRGIWRSSGHAAFELRRAWHAVLGRLR